jgi:hypothetical protein
MAPRPTKEKGFEEIISNIAMLNKVGAANESYAKCHRRINTHHNWNQFSRRK